MSIIILLERYNKYYSVLNPVFWKRGQHRPTLLCSMARVRTSLKTLQWIGCCVTRGLQRLHPESHFSMDDTVMHCRRCVFRRSHVISSSLGSRCVPWLGEGLSMSSYIGPNSQIPRGRPSLLYDHINVILRVVV